MNRIRRRGVATTVTGGLAVALLLAGSVQADATAQLALTGVGGANPVAPGLTSANRLSPQLAAIIRAQGSLPVENPQDGIGYYGYDSIANTPPLLPTLTGVDALTEAKKTEPDKNTYLVLPGQRGADATYDYGTHFLFQGHESGVPGYVSRINLDADPAHRVTVLATRDTAGQPLPAFDGSTWNPFAGKLLLTSENGCSGGVWQGDPRFTPGSTFGNIPALGQGGYEGIQVASDGSIYIVEDVGGATGPATNAKAPNSYLYRFVPTSRDLSTGTLQALQVLRADGRPMETGDNTFGPDIAALHTYGQSFHTTWVTVRATTAANRAETFCSGPLARASGATEFKRPENGVFRPGSNFGDFYFTETGDTNLDSTANQRFGGFGGVFRLSQSGPGASTGTLSLFYRGDAQHTGFDNIQFATDSQLLVVEDAGDTLHAQRNALDSGYLFDTTKTGQQPVRFLAEGRDPSATIDSSLAAIDAPGFANDGDNELTGIHVSDGDPSPGGLLGAKTPTPFLAGWRTFFTQQHGDNVTYEIVPNPTTSPYRK